VWLQYKEPSDAAHQTYQEHMLLNFIVAYSTNSSVDNCLSHVYFLLVKPVNSVFVTRKQRYTSVVQEDVINTSNLFHKEGCLT
jgi:hypothetical protein